MTAGLDHVVMVVPALDAAADRFRAAGFEVIAGGRHVAHGVANMLMGLADGTYLELFCFVEPDKAPADHAMTPLFTAGQGLAAYWLASTALETDIARWRAAGVAYTEPQELARTRPDGTVVRFRLSTPLGPLARCYPFLIEDVSSRSQRVPATGDHTNGISGVHAIWIAAPDATVAAHYTQGLGRVGQADGALARFALPTGQIVIDTGADRPPAAFASLGAAAWGPERLILCRRADVHAAPLPLPGLESVAC